VTAVGVHVPMVAPRTYSVRHHGPVTR
jgi:hypothetical protein